MAVKIFVRAKNLRVDRREAGGNRFNPGFPFRALSGDGVFEIAYMGALIDEGHHGGQNAAFRHYSGEQNAVILPGNGSKLRNRTGGIGAFHIDRPFFQIRR